MPPSIASTVARRCTMSGTELKPPGMTSRSATSGGLISGSISSRRDISAPLNDGKSDVSLGRDFVALLAVLAHPAHVRHEDAGLPGHVRAHVPGVGRRVERVAGQLVDVVHPGVL